MPRRETVDVSELLRIAGPSIECRTRLEVLGESRQTNRMVVLQAAILDDPLVQRVVSWQQADGWLGKSFHGADGIEAAVRILCEKGVSPDHPVLSRALDALAVGDDRLHLGIGKVGHALDLAGLGGSEMIRAAVFSYAGDEDRPFVREQTEEALRGFQAVVDVESIDAITKTYKGKRVFREGVRWPSIYHLRLLAGTSGWQGAENLSMLVRAVARLAELSPIPDIYLRRGSQLMAPASFGMDDFAMSLNEAEGHEQMLWLHRTELLARLGVISSVSPLKRMVDQLGSMLEDGLFWHRLNHPSFRSWGAYTGLGLERDWRSPNRRIADLTFRTVLILHYTGSSSHRPKRETTS